MKSAARETKARMLTSLRPTPIAAIDVGSNAIRLVLGDLDHHRDIKITKKIREPVRLGKDVFADGEISAKTAARAIETFVHFAEILDANKVVHSRAIATSALREAKNRDWFVAEVRKASGIHINVIDGLEEGKLIHSAVSSRIELEDKTSLLIDIGGGSVELTVSIDGIIAGTETFKLGTVRLLQMLEKRGLKERHAKTLINENFAPIKEFMRKTSRGRPIDACIGTGGNFECLGKLRVALLNRNSIFSMNYHELSQLVEHLGSMSIKERIQFLRLRPDRADVVVLAALVTQAIMGSLAVEVLLVPYVGLRDGILNDIGRRFMPAATS